MAIQDGRTCQLQQVKKVIGSHDTSALHCRAVIDVKRCSLAAQLIFSLHFISMATCKCPGCKHHFNNHRALGTHKRYCQTKITAIARKLLEQHKIIMERIAREENIVNPKEEPEVE